MPEPPVQFLEARHEVKEAYSSHEKVSIFWAIRTESPEDRSLQDGQLGQESARALHPNYAL